MPNNRDFSIFNGSMASAFVPVDLDKLLDEFEEKEQGEFASSVREGET